MQAAAGAMSVEEKQGEEDAVPVVSASMSAVGSLSSDDSALDAASVLGFGESCAPSYLCSVGAGLADAASADM